MKKCVVAIIVCLMIFCPSVVFAEETYTFTENELYDYVYEQVRNDPEAYGVVSMDDYVDLQNSVRLSEEYEKAGASSNTLDKYDILTLILIGIAIAGISHHIGTKKNK